MSEFRFFIDHGMIHDRLTGKHVTTEPDTPFCDGIVACCSLLNELATGLNAEIEGSDRQKQAHEDGLRRSPKWAAMTPEQQSHCAFMGFDPDNPDVPSD